MTSIEIEFLTQLRASAGCDGMRLDSTEAMTVSTVIVQVIEAHPVLRALLVDEAGSRHGWLMIGVNDAMVARGSDPPIAPGSTVVLGTPVSGG